MDKDKVNQENQEEKEDKGILNVKKVSAYIVILSLIAFLIIVYFTDLIGEKFGDSFENLALGGVALLLIVAWYFNNKAKDK